MSKSPEESGVGQLTFTLPFLEGKDETEETQADAPAASHADPPTRSKPPGKKKWHSLIDKVYALPNLERAWQRVKANRGAAGDDGMTLARFEEGASERLEQLAADLRAKSYRPRPVKRVFIPKSGGGSRPLGIPTVRDRIVQQALLQVLSPIFEAKFSPRSHGFRPEKGCKSALEVVDRAVKHGYEWVVDADICTFFDSVDHERLLDALNEEVADGTVLKLIRRILEAGVSLPEAAEVEPTELGTPQGGPLSPLLANVYLHAFDQAMEEARVGLVRYADDFVLFARSKEEATAALERARAVLEGELGLGLHPEKTKVVTVTEGFEFLGFHYFRDPASGRLVKEVRPKSVRRFRDAIRERTPRLHTQRRVKAHHVTLQRLAKNQRLREMVVSVNRYLAGWHGYFKPLWSRYEPPFGSFDGFVRRRVRQALIGRVGNGWWNQRLTNSMLRELGLISLTERQQQYLRGLEAVPARKG